MRVDFYILESASPSGRLQFACRLTEKAYGLDNKVYAHTATATDAQMLDDLLWTFRQGSFVPHACVGQELEGNSATASGAPVRIGTPEASDASGDLLINLADAVPEFVDEFERVAESVGGDEAAVKAGRARFKQYRDRGIEPVTHKISG